MSLDTTSNKEDVTIDTEMSKLLKARACLEKYELGKSKTELEQLESAMLTPELAKNYLSIKKGRDHEEIKKFIDDALSYYISIYKLTQSGVIFPEMSEDLAVRAINAHWRKSIPFFVISAAILLILGGTTTFGIQITGLESRLHGANQVVDTLNKEADKKKREMSALLEKVTQEATSKQAGIDKTAGEFSSKITNRYKTFSTQIDQAKQSADNKINDYVAAKEKDFDNKLNQGQTAALTDAKGKVQARVDKIGQSLEQTTPPLVEKLVQEQSDRAKDMIDKVLKNALNSEGQINKLLLQTLGQEAATKKAVAAVQGYCTAVLKAHPPAPSPSPPKSGGRSHGPSDPCGALP